ncbi:MAG: ethanolamine utilization protein EutP [Propionibacterium sp.]|nr:ethanolamine utilization protein EutP [Propionibacterium sp.]
MDGQVLIVGSVGAGKTTIRQRLLDQPLEDVKTQGIDVIDGVVDTPGEYMHHSSRRGSLQVLGYDAGCILLVLDASSDESRIPPGFASTFNRRVVGVATKIDLATDEQIESARGRLIDAGADEVVSVSGITGEGFDDLKETLWRQ